MLNIWPLIKLDLSVFTLQISLFIIKVTPIAAWLHVELVEEVVGKMAARARLCEVVEKNECAMCFLGIISSSSLSHGTVCALPLRWST